MIKFDTCKRTFPHAKLSRSADGILEVVLHTDADTLVFNGHTHEAFYREDEKVLATLLDIAVPVIAALHDPAMVQSEYMLLCDVVIATPDIGFQDEPHFCFSIVPGDGIHSLLTYVIGALHSRSFGLTPQEPRAEEAKAPSVANEIVDRERLLRRSREIAAGMATLPPLTARYSRVPLTQPLRRLVDESVDYRLALEDISPADIAHAGAAR